MLKPRLILGVAPHRSATTSLSWVLNWQPGAYITHEGALFYPWRYDALAARTARKVLASQLDKAEDRGLRYTGDVSPFYLPYLPALRAYFGSRLFVLSPRRSLRDWVPSFEEHIYEPGMFSSNRTVKERAYPIIEGSARTSVLQYYAQFYQSLRAFGTASIFRAEELDSKYGQRRVLDAAGFLPQDQSYCPWTRENSTRTPNEERA